MSKRTGTNTGSISESPARRKRRAEARRREEEAWAARSGPVTTRRTDPMPAGTEGEAPNQDPVDWRARSQGLDGIWDRYEALPYERRQLFCAEFPDLSQAINDASLGLPDEEGEGPMHMKHPSRKAIEAGCDCQECAD